MSTQPHKITILRSFDQQNYFTVIAQPHGFQDHNLEVQDGLAFDEMMGLMARLFVPTMDDGTPNRQVGKPLFLSLPEKEPSK